MYSFEKVYSRMAMAVLLIGSVVLSAGVARGQEPNPTSIAAGPGSKLPAPVTKGEDGIYLYHVKVVARELDAVNFLNRSGSTPIGFVGTELMPGAHGAGKVNSLTGKTTISVKFDGLT